MPGPLIPDPTPSWLKPENASVFDSPLTKAMRAILHTIGADNPTAQVFGLMTSEVPTGGAQGGIVGAIGRLVEKAKAASEYLHGSSAAFDEFKLMPGRNQAIFLSKPQAGRVSQAEHIAKGPFGGRLYSVQVDESALKKFDPLNDPQAKAIYEKLYPGQPVRQWVEYPNMHEVLKATEPHGYNDFIVNEPSVQGVSRAITDPKALKITAQTPTRGLTAYHGSPYDFEKFSTEKIGTGEGAQAYGHGLYFAEHEGVAQQYKRILGNRAFKVGDRELVSPMGGSTRALDTQTRGENIATQALDDAFNAQSSSPAQFAANRLRQQARYYPEEAQHIQEALNVISEWQKTGEVQKMGGKMYEVAIHADPEHFLDWDKPLSQQSETVKDALRKLDPERMDMIRNRSFDISGSKFFDDLAEKQAGNAGAMPQWARVQNAKPLASQALREAGVPGIKYLDQGSRSAGEGTRNYVVFDDKTIEILKKYGWILPMAGAGAATEQQK